MLIEDETTVRTGPVPRTASTLTISLTAFDSTGRFDEDAFRLHLRRLAKAGIGVYVAGSGSSEAYTLSTAEIARVMEVAAEELKGKVPVRAMSFEPRTATQMVEYVKLAAAAGLDAVNVYPFDAGHGVKPRGDELDRYFSEVLSSTDIPMIIASHHYSGFMVPVDIIENLIDRFDNVIGVTSVTPDVTYLVKVCERVADRVQVHSGSPGHVLTNLALGGSGFLSSEGNLVPQLCQGVVEAYNRRDRDETNRLYSLLLRVYSLNTKYGSIRGIKGALSAFGLPGGPPRLPRTPIQADEQTEFVGALRRLNVPEFAGL